MDLLLNLLSALCWGSLVLPSTKLGGDSRSQLLGTASGAFLFSVVIYLYKIRDLSWFIFFIGCIASALIIIEVLFTVKEKPKNKSGDRKKGLLVLLFSIVGFLAYFVIIRWFEIDGWSAILPQGVGMVTGALLFSIKHRPFNKYALRNDAL
ncbi:GRP family sugar transporter [Ectobacillus antri]|jgi:glucose uptake protein|uniref:GRP family sugar transporter n=1 Tax=Ectobacillus antri TaxID=2486280 RepID=A0ABT6H775_9BACI|nr:GRP family sugar transporter [Ectobacillus antri]MDG4656867.1 GRP family sugar transporter [Ectobacillus antri]MDG5754236.1 GRP family sugar transporter [Ectobacillus antri]